MGNGDDPVWKAIDGLRKDVKDLAVEGCAFRKNHEDRIDEEKKERKETMEKLSKDIKAVRNQILLGIAALMALTLVIDKVLK
jgi:7-cyano-7-deazaguanine synthase in queuosine biosynthesis